MSKKIYDDFYKEHGPDVHLDPVRFEKIASLCKGKVLDIGCGTGTLADFYKLQYTGIDISSEAISMARNIRRKDADYICSEVNEIDKFVDAKFDTIVMAEFLEHLHENEFNFEMIQKFCKADTRIIISVPNGDRIPDPTHMRTFTVPELRKKFAKLGKIQFHNWAGFRGRIMMTIDLAEKNDELLSLMITAKNEEKGLENAILSCIDFVDNIVITVDRASKDNTLQIAKRYADTLKEYTWENSFCKARNFTQEGIKTKWVLMLDGHEYVKEGYNLKEALKLDCDGLSIKIELENKFSFYFPRIIRNYVQWENDLHNNPKAEKCVAIKDLIIVHDRDNLQSKKGIEERNKQRSEMVEKIFGKILKHDKKNIRALFYTAQHANYQKDFKKALKFYKCYLKYSKNKEERWLVCFEMTEIYIQLGKYWRAMWYAWKAEEEIQNRWETRYILASAYAAAGWTTKATEYFTTCFDLNEKKHVYNPLEQNLATIWETIGMCFFTAGNMAKANIAWNRAITIEKSHGEKNRNDKRIEFLSALMKQN